MRNPLEETSWARRPLVCLLTAAGAGGAVVIVLAMAVSTLIGTVVTGGPQFGGTSSATFVLIIGLTVGVPTGLVVAAGGTLGSLVGRVLRRETAGTVVGALGMTIAATAVASWLDPSFSFALFVALAGVVASIVFGFLASWRRAASPTSPPRAV